jgi:hypothetical protein
MKVSFAKLGLDKLCLGHIRIGHDDSGKVKARSVLSRKVALAQVIKLIACSVRLSHLAAVQNTSILIRKVNRGQLEILGLAISK